VVGGVGAGWHRATRSPHDRKQVHGVAGGAGAAGTGSDITIATTVHNDYSSHTGIMALPANDKDCVSNGTVEQHITTAFQVTATQL
jgi:hypothetical protein